MDQAESARSLRILMLEDTASDAALIEHELRRAGIAFSATRVETHDAFVQALQQTEPDLILSDYTLPDVDGLAAIELAKRYRPDVPIIMVTGALSDIEAVDLLHAGAKDYVLKDRMARLAPAVHRVLAAEQGVRMRKAAERALLESEQKFHSISVAAQDAIVMVDDAGCIDFWNPAAETIFGYSAAEALGKDLSALLVPERLLDDFRRGFARFRETGIGTAIGMSLESSALRRDGAEFPVELSLSSLRLQQRWRGLAIVRDISERVRSAEALRASHALLSSIVENAPIRVFWKDTASRYLGCNSAFARDAGLARPEDLIGKSDFEMGWRAHAESYRADDQRVMESDEAKLAYDEPQTARDGRPIWLRTSKVPLHDATGKVIGVLGISENITARKLAELEREQYFKLFTASVDLMGIAEPNGAFKKVNPAFLDTLGYSEAEMLAKPFIEFVHPDDRQATRDEIARQLERGYSLNFENRYVCKDGSVRWLSWRAKVSYAENLTYATARDITERKCAETEMLRLNRALKTLSAGNRTMLHAGDEAELMQDICELITASGNYVLAWIGLARNDAAKSIDAVAVSGAGKDYAEALRLTWDDRPAGRGPTGTAVRTGCTQIAQDIPNDARMAPWREAAAKFGYASSIALPLRADAATIGALSIYSSEPAAFNAGEVALLEEVAADLSFGIVSLRTRSERNQAIKEREQYAERLRASLEEALLAIAATVEARDAYTAGHQRRVADLAVAIAREMGLAQEQVHGLRLAGIVHDLGKISVPSEILSRPGRLSAVELNLIRTHAQAGYEILKGIEFPWPIAQTVLQHHERLDGSGYPQGLKDGQILLEARILAVADTVEAMSSHRPYRPGLGEQTALEEISKNRGVLYDPTVVDTCLRLFLEQKYSLPPA